MVIKELQMRMAYPESCFQAGTAEECAAAIREWKSPSSVVCNMPLREIIQLFCSSNMDPRLVRESANLGPLNLFVIVSGMRI